VTSDVVRGFQGASLQKSNSAGSLLVSNEGWRLNGAGESIKPSSAISTANRKMKLINSSEFEITNWLRIVVAEVLTSPSRGC